MEEQVSDYLLEDFKNLVEKSRTHVAAAKASKNAERHRGAKALLKEATKACKEIEPLVQRQTALYGVNFVHAVKSHSEIAQHIDALHKKAYAFDEADDSSDEDSDDAWDDSAEELEAYKELVELTREAALGITPILKRMILEAPAPQAHISTPPTTPLPVASPAPTAALPRVSSLDGQSLAPDSPHLSTVPAGRLAGTHQLDAQSQRGSADALIMGIRSGPDEGVYGPAHASRSQYPPSRSTSQHSAVSSSLRSIPEPVPRSIPEPAPPIPETNPWHIGQAPVANQVPGSYEPSGDDSDTAEIERRPRTAAPPSRPDSPTLPPKKKLPKIPSVSRLSTTSNNTLQSSTSSSTASPTYVRSGYHTPHQPNRNTLVCFPPTPSQNRPMPVSAYQVSVEQGVDSLPSQRGPRQSNSGQDYPPTHYPRIQPPPVQQKQQAIARPVSAADSEVSVDTFLENVTAGPPHNLAPDTVSPVIESPAGGCMSRASFYTARSGLETTAPPQAAMGTQLQPHVEQPGLEVVVGDQGLIPAHAQAPTSATTSAPTFVPRPRQAICNIGPGSSFYLLKGFCEGAKEVQRGGAGVKRVKKMSYGGGAPYVAKCTHCFFELSWDAVMNDLKNDPSHNFQYEQLLWFRLRFLSKSHMPAKHVDDQLYSCLFCVQEGRTLEESDATVFFSRAQLFAHLARHPRPLPNVTGLTVIDGPHRPPELVNDYDLHFAAPPTKSPLDGIRRELQMLPTGTTTTMFRAPRRPSDGAVALQFPAGAKIVGIEFPAKYEGEWGVGWYDNMRGPFLAECVRLDSPPSDEMRAQGTSTRQAIARWKWAINNTYKNADWLRIDKGETISNIVYSHPSHWCWAGTNSRGKWGYFPQSHLDPNSIKESTPGSDTASISSSGRTASISVTASSSNNNGGGAFRFKKWTSSKSTNSKRPNSDGSLSTVSSH